MPETAPLARRTPARRWTGLLAATAAAGGIALLLAGGSPALADAAAADSTAAGGSATPTGRATPPAVGSGTNGPGTNGRGTGGSQEVAAQDDAGQQARDRHWQEVLRKAHGQQVYFNAWGGEPRINAFIDWAGQQVEQAHGVSIRHVKLGTTAEAVSRILSEMAAGNTGSGSVDLIWINGENFAALQRRGMLFGPWTDGLPNMRYVDPQAMPSVATDFGIPVDNMEAPWGLAQLVFLHDTERMPDPPRGAYELLDWAVANPGRFTYPQPPNFMGTTFLRQLLYDLTADRQALFKPVSAVDPDDVAVTVWSYLDRLHPLLWRSGVAFPQNTGAARNLFEDGEIEITISFDPAEAANGIASGALPKTTAVYTFRDGTVGNASFLAIPSNSPNKEAAMVLANFLLSPAAQARKQDPAVWGNQTVLSLPLLAAEEKSAFQAFDRMPGMPKAGSLGTPLPEPHPSWTQYLDEQWSHRYAGGD